ncbi:MAG: tRNA (N(6)-L-threonylcarbamoyladenosine(37)-C(2))-methylthiotransferase MtaB, partial [Deltaproteobacteria bacterium]|nr:tRNA (N(6)-L-threonylcarbamoyladenosine(37)-C(2))-methylthiotransferase MtaB [Deltaproteobacteria bacterium]
GARKGHSRNYLPVLVDTGEARVNREVEVLIEGMKGDWLQGSIVSG